MFQLPENFQKKRYRQTEELELTQRLNDLRSRFAISHPATIDTAIRLAEILGYQGRYRAAELLFKQSANCLLTNFGQNDPRTIIAFERLAYCYFQQDQLSKAEKLFGMLYSKASQILPSSSREFLRIKKDFGYCKFQLGDPAAAEQAVREVLAIGSQVLPANYRLIRDCMTDLAIALMDRGGLDAFSEAERLLSDLTEVSALYKDIPVAARLYNRTLLATIHNFQGKHHLAEQVLREVCETQTLTLGREHADTLQTTTQPVKTLKELGRFLEGEELLRDAPKISTKILGEKHWLVSQPADEDSLHS